MTIQTIQKEHAMTKNHAITDTGMILISRSTIGTI